MQRSPADVASEMLEHFLVERWKENLPNLEGLAGENLFSALHEVLWRQVYLTSCQMGVPESPEGHRALKETAQAQSHEILTRILGD